MQITKYRNLPLLNLHKKKYAGRNSNGKITIRHRGAGHQDKIRLIDWSRSQGQGIVIGLEYAPKRNIVLAKIYHEYSVLQGNLSQLYRYSYILAPLGLKIFQKLYVYIKALTFYDKIKGLSVILMPGDCSLLSYFEPGDIIHNIEMYPGEGAVFARSAGTFCQIRALTNNLINSSQTSLFSNIGNNLVYDIKLRNQFCMSIPLIKIRRPSGSQRLIIATNSATRGIVSQKLESKFLKKKAGRSRWLGWRPSVRGVARNPVDHPHGGGQGKTSGGRPSVTFKGWPTKGQPTRKIKRTNTFIVFSCKQSLFT